MESVLSRTTPFIKEAEGSVQNLVSHPVLVASPEAEFRAIARVLLEERIGALPIVSEAGGLMGMITRSDILRVLVAHSTFINGYKDTCSLAIGAEALTGPFKSKTSS